MRDRCAPYKAKDNLMGDVLAESNFCNLDAVGFRTSEELLTSQFRIHPMIQLARSYVSVSRPTELFFDMSAWEAPGSRAHREEGDAEAIPGTDVRRSILLASAAVH